MKISKKSLTALAVAFVAMVPWTSAFSQTAESSYYGGVGYLSSTFGGFYDDFCDNFSLIAIASDITQTRDCDSSSGSGLKIYGGRRFNQNFAVELGYADFGEVTANETGTVNGSDVGVYTLKESWDTSSMYLAAVGIYPVSESVDLFGKLGYHRFSSDFRVSGILQTGVNASPVNSSGMDFLYGIGAQWISGSDFGAQWISGSNFGVRGEWEKFNLDNGEVSAFTVSAIYQF